MVTPTMPKRKGVSVVQVAQRLQIRYQKARDIMLSGRCGPTWFEGRALFAEEVGVAEYIRTQGARRVASPVTRR